jgi:hypothetical protein
MELKDVLRNFSYTTLDNISTFYLLSLSAGPLIEEKAVEREAGSYSAW